MQVTKIHSYKLDLTVTILFFSMTYNEKEMTRKLMEEEDEVLELNNWIAAPPITATI